jgi:hypothetical protein
MSKHINVNPDHYKVAGRERQGEDVVHSTERRTLARLRRQERLIHPFESEVTDQPAAEPRSTASETTRKESPTRAVTDKRR